MWSKALGVYAIGAVLARLADEGARVSLVFLALERSGTAGAGGALVAALLIPHVVAAPVIGLVADRAQRPAHVVAAAILAFGAALATCAALLGHLPLWPVLAILVAGGCCGPAITGALTSLVPHLVTQRQLPRAFGLDSLTYNAAGLAGPALAALLTGLFSAVVATGVLAGAAIGGALLVGTLPVRAAGTRPGSDHALPAAPPPAPAQASPAPAEGALPRVGAAGDLLRGLQIMMGNRDLACVTAATSLGQLGFGALPVVVAVIAQRQGTPAAAGWILTALAAGGIAGSLVWSWRPARPGHAARIVMLGLAGAALPLAVAALATSSLAVLTALFAVSGVVNGPLFGAVLMTRQQAAPAGFQSQIFALGAGAKLTAAAAGAALAGFVTGLTAGAQLLLVAACPLLAAGLGAAALAGTARVQLGP